MVVVHEPTTARAREADADADHRRRRTHEAAEVVARHPGHVGHGAELRLPVGRQSEADQRDLQDDNAQPEAGEDEESGADERPGENGERFRGERQERNGFAAELAGGRRPQPE